MNAPGAKKWMHHMALALNEDMDWSGLDPRVKPCIVDFLYTRMQKYAVAHNWEFDQSDFDCFKVDAEAWREVEAPASAPTPIQALSKERRPSDDDTTAPTG